MEESREMSVTEGDSVHNRDSVHKSSSKAKVCKTVLTGSGVF